MVPHIFQLPGVLDPGGFHATDGLVHQGLCRGRLIRLVVSVPAVADQVDYHVALESGTEITGDFHHVVHGLRIVAVHVKNGCVHHLGDCGAIQRRTRILALADGESDLVVDHDVQAAPNRETPGFRHLEQFHDHALAGKCRIAVYEYGHDQVMVVVTPPYLPGPRGTGHHRVHDFQVGGVKGHGHVYPATGCLDVRGESQVILDVAGTLQVLVVFAFELVEQQGRGFSEDVDQHVQPAAVRHAEHDFLNPVGAGMQHGFMQQGYQAVTALQREPFSGPRNVCGEISPGPQRRSAFPGYGLVPPL